MCLTPCVFVFAGRWRTPRAVAAAAAAGREAEAEFDSACVVWTCGRRAAGGGQRADHRTDTIIPPHTPRQGQPLPKIETQGQDRVVFFL